MTVNVVPREYVAESVVRSLKSKVKGKRVLLVRAKVARDVIPRELRRAGAHVDVVEAYETVVPQSSRTRLRAALKIPRSAHTSLPSPVRPRSRTSCNSSARAMPELDGIHMASIGPVTSATLARARPPSRRQSEGIYDPRPHRCNCARR